MKGVIPSAITLGESRGAASCVLSFRFRGGWPFKSGREVDERRVVDGAAMLSGMPGRWADSGVCVTSEIELSSSIPIQ